MSKENTTSQRAHVPGHLFETMLRAAMNAEGSLKIWKDDLLHWNYSTTELDQFESALKDGTKVSGYKETAKEVIDFIETKVRNRKD